MVGMIFSLSWPLVVLIIIGNTEPYNQLLIGNEIAVAIAYAIYALIVITITLIKYSHRELEFYEREKIIKKRIAKYNKKYNKNTLNHFTSHKKHKH